MKKYIPLIVAALWAWSLSGCSPHTTAATNPKSIDLGEVEVADGSTNRINLGDGRVCVVRSSFLKDQKVLVGQQETKLEGRNVSLWLDIEQADSGGAPQILWSGKMITQPDKPTAILGADGSLKVMLVPHIKKAA